MKTPWKSEILEWLWNRPVGLSTFSLADIYKAGLGKKTHPKNHRAEEKIRQALQEFEREGVVTRVKRGIYYYLHDSRSPSTKTAKSIVQLGRVDLTQYIAMYRKATKKQAPLNVARPGGYQKRSVPKQDGLTPNEVECIKDLYKEFPASEGYQHLKAGGTPDIHSQKVMPAVKDEDGPYSWVTFQTTECKDEHDRLAEQTQFNVVAGLDNAHRRGIAIPVKLYIYGGR